MPRIRGGIGCAVPRVSDDDEAGVGPSFYQPGVWAATVLELKRRQAVSVEPYLEDPRMVLALPPGKHVELRARAVADAEAVFAERYASREPVTVDLAVLRGIVPNEMLFRDRSIHWCTVHSDDGVISSANTPASVFGDVVTLVRGGF